MTEEAASNMVISAGVVTAVLGVLLAITLKLSKKTNMKEEEVVEEVVEEVDELDTAKYPGGYITIYYGSQTGTAESFANDIEKEGDEKGFKINVVDLEDIEDDFEGEILKEKCRDANGKSRAIFMMATYGEGDPTDNAVSFLKFLKESAEPGEEKKEGEQIFGNLEYGVFGLGNTQYEHFNATGKKVDSYFELMGGKRIVKLGLGDDDNDLEGDFENWKDSVFWPSLKKRFNIGDDAVLANGDSGEKLPDCHYAVEFLKSASSPDMTLPDNVPLSSKQYFAGTDCTVTLKRELRDPSDEGSTIHVEIDATDIEYQTADNLGILPVNDNSVVEKVAEVLGYDLNATFKLHAAKGHEAKFAPIFPTPCTVHDCLARYCDLVGPPRRSDLKALAAYASDPTSKSALLRMASKEGKTEYKEKVLDAKIGFVDIITKLCPSISMPLEHFIAVCPRLQPRFYTISSSSSVHPNSVHITVSVLSQKRDDGSFFKGVCSNYLTDIVKNGKARVFVRDSTFRLPTDTTKPIIMIGPGTGIAPMRALLQERECQKTQRKLNVGKNILYFGCKKRSQDYIYREELEKYKNDGILTDLHLAFSREQAKKVYVQDLLAANAKETFNLIEKEGAYVYVCGGVKMGSDVTETLRQIVKDHGKFSSDDAKEYIQKMTTSGRYVQELWA